MDGLMEMLIRIKAGENGEHAIAFIRESWANRLDPHTRDAIRGAVMSLRVVRGRGVHSHKCGHIDADETRSTGVEASDGCGYVWEHDEEAIHSEEEHTQAHTCPRCGKGTWYLQYRNHKGHYILADGSGCSLYEPVAA